MPTTGTRLMTIRMLIVNWRKMSEAIPKVMREPSRSEVLSENLDALVYEGGEKQEQDDGAHKAPFFAKNREYEVRVMFRNEVELVLRPVEVALAEKPARPHRNLRLYRMITVSCRVRLRVEETEDTHFLIGLHEKFPENGKARQTDDADENVGRFRETHEPEDAETGKEDDDRGPEVRLLENKNARHEHVDQGKDDVLQAEGFAFLFSLVEHVRKKKYYDRFHELRRLQVDAREGDPPLGAARYGAQYDNDDDEKKDDEVEILGITGNQAVIVGQDQEDRHRALRRRRPSVSREGWRSALDGIWTRLSD